MMGQFAVRRTGRRCRGVTLLEVLVAIAAAAVIFGVAMGILLTTNQTADRAISRESLLHQAQLAMKQIQSVIEATVWPEDLATSPPADAAVAFAKDGLALFSSHQPTTGGLFCHYKILTTLAPVSQGGEPRPIALCIRMRPGTTEPISADSLGGEYDATVAFRYAPRVGADLQPDWQESLTAGQKPRLIWVELIMRDRERRDRQGNLQEVRLVTAISL